MKCHDDKFPTAHILFHRVKFPHQKAFYIAFLGAIVKKGISRYELGRKFRLHWETCRLFKRKAMKSNYQCSLQRAVEMGKFYVGGPQKGKRGRSNNKKGPVACPLHQINTVCIENHAWAISSISTAELFTFAGQRRSVSVSIQTDDRTGCTLSKKSYPNPKPEPLNKRGISPFIHRQIIMIKAWPGRIHYQYKHLQTCLNEFNRLKHMDDFFHNFRAKMMEHPPIIYQKLKMT